MNLTQYWQKAEVFQESEQSLHVSGPGLWNNKDTRMTETAVVEGSEKLALAVNAPASGCMSA